MATWMEKDVLIEFISHVVAVTARDVDVDNPDVIELLELKHKLYCMDPEEIRRYLKWMINQRKYRD